MTVIRFDYSLFSVYRNVILILINSLAHKGLTFNAPVGHCLLETLWKKGENADNQHFLLFPQCFLPFQREIAP